MTEVNDQSLSDLRRVKLQLLAEANELCQRALITAEEGTIKQNKRDRMILFEGAMDQLMALGANIASYSSDSEVRALRLAYDVVSGEMELRDMAFYDVSYGSCDGHTQITLGYY